MDQVLGYITVAVTFVLFMICALFGDQFWVEKSQEYRKKRKAWE